MEILNENTLDEVNPYGLLSPATRHAQLSDGEWLQASAYWTPSCAVEHQAVALSGNYATEKYNSNGGTGTGSPMQAYTPFEVVTSFTNTTMGLSPTELQDLAIKQAKQSLQYNLEREFWSGALTSQTSNPNRFLTDHTSYLYPTSTPSAEVSLAILEQNLGGVSNPTIHMPRAVATILRVKPDKNGIMRTRAGSRVIIGDGYNTNVTGDEGEGRYVMVGTGAVEAYWGEFTVLPETYSRLSVNSLSYTVSVPAAVFWNDCRHYIIQIDIKT